ncbi:MAG: hypothetical protein JWQ98_1801 [Chlorobi bacterium]|nr:hypothetical protein [Chlorobiota bacterium]
MKRLLYLSLVLTLFSAGAAIAQEPTIIAIFPLKNLGGEVIYDSLGWKYADSLEAYLNSKAESGKIYKMIAMDDLRDQMLAQNVDIKSPSYETDIWKIVKLLGAKKLIWGTYLVKYDRANVELKVYDVRTMMYDMANFAKVRAPYTDAVSTVTAGGDKILPALK